MLALRIDSPRFIFLLLKRVYFDNGIQIQGTKQVREWIFGWVHLFELQLGLQLRDFHLQQHQILATSIEALGRLRVLFLSAKVNETLL